MIPQSPSAAAAWNHVACQVAAEAARQFGSLRFRALGSSMHPSLRAGDVLCVEHVAPATLRPGDIAVLDCDGALLAHRVLKVAGETILTRGDAHRLPDPPFPGTQLVGRVHQVLRDGRPVAFSPAGLRRPLAFVLRHSALAARIYARAVAHRGAAVAA